MRDHRVCSPVPSMATAFSSEVRCPLCGGISTRPLEQSGDVRVELCARCDVAFVRPVPPAAELENHYDANYYAEWMTAQQRARARLWQQRLRSVTSMIDLTKGKQDLLDVGCGEGGFLQAARGAGLECAGTELSRYAADHVRLQLGIPVASGELRSISWPAASYDIVTMWHVLEHLTDPRSELVEVHRLLRPGGRLFVAVPNRTSYLFNLVYRIAKGGPPPLYSPREKELHLFHFTMEGLRRLLMECGFVVRTMGLDAECADWRKRWVDRPARGWFYLTGMNWSTAMLAVAEKPHDSKAN